MRQSTNTIFLITPNSFAYNAQTAPSNTFQTNTAHTARTSTKQAQSEFQAFVAALKAKDINVHVFDDTPHPHKPDAVFPNNWISTHDDGIIILYPLHAQNRRHERRADIVTWLQQHFIVRRVVDLSEHEADNRFLEGTGSIVFDHINKMAYACLSPRTDQGLFLEVCRLLGYKPVHFSAYDAGGTAVYHTNVMLCVGEQFAVVCGDSICNQQERNNVVALLASTGHEVIDISIEQMNAFAGNMLEVRNNSDERFLVLSQRAFEILPDYQRLQLEKYCTLLPVSINTIETIGGGSVRCIMAEIFLKPLN